MSARRLHLYGVGAGKSGTHSVADMFATHYRAAHEAEARELMELLFGVWHGERTRGELTRFLAARDRRLDLEVDASLVLGEVVGELVAMRPAARFLLTIRDPWSWLDSMINHSLAHETPDHWVSWREHRYRADALRHPPGETCLAERGLYTLDGYLGAWAAHNRLVLETVPHDRLLVVRTDELSNRIGAIAGFAGIPEDSIDESRSHAFPAAGRFDVLADLDPGYVTAKVDEHGGDLVRRWFPELA